MQSTMQLRAAHWQFYKVNTFAPATPRDFTQWGNCMINSVSTKIKWQHFWAAERGRGKNFQPSHFVLWFVEGPISPGEQRTKLGLIS